jgi:hypothetical protein
MQLLVENFRAFYRTRLDNGGTAKRFSDKGELVRLEGIARLAGPKLWRDRWCFLSPAQDRQHSRVKWSSRSCGCDAMNCEDNSWTEGPEDL